MIFFNLKPMLTEWFLIYLQNYKKLLVLINAFFKYKLFAKIISLNAYNLFFSICIKWIMI